MPLAWFEQRAMTTRDFPGYPNAATFSSLWQQAVARGSRITLTGESADFWLYGSRIYYAEELAERRWSSALDCFRADIAAYGIRQPIAWLIRQGLFPLLPMQLQQLLRTVRDGCKPEPVYWLSPSMQKVLKESRDRSLPQDSGTVRRFGQQRLLEFLDNAFAAQINEGDERLAAQFGIEIRDPYSDRRFVEYAFSTPSRLRLRGDRTKYIHVRALQDLLPRLIIERKINAEFSSVFHAQLDGMQNVLTETLPGRRPDWVTADGMARLFEVFRNDPQDGVAFWVLWGIYGCDRVLR
jgi:asparagine synthase (glutamine-hydrolysing)